MKSSASAEKQKISDAIREINARTKVLKLVSRTTESNYVSIVRGGPGTG